MMHPNNFDIIEDDPTPYEKPKRKGKPIDWRLAGMVTGIVLGVITAVIVCLAVGGWIGQAATTIEFAIFPDGMPKELKDLQAIVTIPLSIMVAISILGYAAGKLGGDK